MRLATILARGGSQGVPGKNLRELAGKPLIVHTIDQARASGMFDVIAVSSDSDAILEVARKAGVDEVVKRPAELANHTAPKVPGIRHCLFEVERRRNVRFDVVADLAVTSPLRAPEDIQGAIRLLEETGVSNVLSGSPAAKSPYFTIVELNEGGFIRRSKSTPTPIFCRQDAPQCYDLNGAVYVWRREILEPDDSRVLMDDSRLFIMPAERAPDIDTELDFLVIEAMTARLAR